MTGYAIAFGTSAGGFVGTDGYFLDNLENHASFFFFQCAFATTAATIDSGAVAERMDLSAYILSSFIICLVIYPFPVHCKLTI